MLQRFKISTMPPLHIIIIRCNLSGRQSILMNLLKFIKPTTPLSSPPFFQCNANGITGNLVLHIEKNDLAGTSQEEGSTITCTTVFMHVQLVHWVERKCQISQSVSCQCHILYSVILTYDIDVSKLENGNMAMILHH